MQKIAIITRTKDRPILLARAIKDVLAQSCDDWLHVIINDGGDKNIIEELLVDFQKQYNGRLLLLHNDKSIGMEAASNKAISASKSDYIVIHDDDDTWHKDFLQKTSAVLNQQNKQQNINELAGVISFTEKITEDIVKDKVKKISNEDFNSSLREITLWRMCAGNIFPPISFLYRRDVYKKIGMYDENLPVMGDWDFNLRFLRHFEIAIIPQHLAYYHHRIPKKDGDIYANSIVGGSNKHDFYSAYLRNKFLRDDMDKNQLGMGYFMNIATNMRVNYEGSEISNNMVHQAVITQSESINHVNTELSNTNTGLHNFYNADAQRFSNVMDEFSKNEEKHNLILRNNIMFRAKSFINKYFINKYISKFK